MQLQAAKPWAVLTDGAERVFLRAILYCHKICRFKSSHSARRTCNLAATEEGKRAPRVIVGRPCDTVFPKGPERRSRPKQNAYVASLAMNRPIADGF